MSMTWLADADSETAWAHQPWTEFAALPDKPRSLVLLPLFGIADHGLGMPLDLEEIVGSAVVKEAVQAAKASIPLRVLPPLRWAFAPYSHTFFGVDAETAHDLIREIAESVRSAGFQKLVFFNTSPWNEELIDAASRDVRAGLGLQTFVINLAGLDLDLHPRLGRTRADVQAVGAYLHDRLPETTSLLPGRNDLCDFRPGRFDQPDPLVAAEPLETLRRRGQERLTSAAARLARLLGEIRDRPLKPATPPPSTL